MGLGGGRDSGRRAGARASSSGPHVCATSVIVAFCRIANWSDENVLTKVREMVLPDIERHGPIEAWIIDDTGLPKKGKHSVGVSHRYCGQLGKQANCQVAVSLSLANRYASLPVAYQLYLPKIWADDSARRASRRRPSTPSRRASRRASKSSSTLDRPAFIRGLQSNR
jgi:SRSO17 transposase